MWTSSALTALVLTTGSVVPQVVEARIVVNSDFPAPTLTTSSLFESTAVRSTATQSPSSIPFLGPTDAEGIPLSSIIYVEATRDMGSSYHDHTPTTAAASTITTIANLDCNADDCLRAFRRHLGQSFCSDFTVPGYQFTSFPSYATMCTGSTSARISSACTCLNQITSSATSKPSLTSSSTSTPTPTGLGKIPFLRGVNLGGWLVVERWLALDLFTGDFEDVIDQWHFDQVPGAKDVLEEHWSTYFTEADVKKIASTGINALRIPVGFWAYNNTGVPYLQGADVYLEKAIGWARDAGMYVWVDCHGSPGSQNGYIHSGHEGNIGWQQGDHQETSIQVLQTMAKKYGAAEYADVVVGLEMVNEPADYGNNNFGVMQVWTKQAYHAIKPEVENEDMVIVMHDAFAGPEAWDNVAKSLLSNIPTGQPKTFGIDTHLYQIYNKDDGDLTQDQHIVEACGWGDALAASNTIAPTYVGEWSAVTATCVEPNGNTTPGSSCSTDGCQCSGEHFDTWEAPLIAQTRRYVEAQMDTFEASSSGWFIWAAKGPGSWSFLDGIHKGIIPNPVTARKFPNQCGLLGKSRRDDRGSLMGVEGV